MPPRRRRPVAKPAATPIRVNRLNSISQWENMQQKASSRGQVILSLFLQGRDPVGVQMRPFFNNLSKMPKYKRVIFAEVNLDEAEDIGRAAGVGRTPTFQCWWEGEMVSTYTGGMLNKVQAQLDAALQEYGRKGGGLGRTLATLLAVAGIAAAGAYAFLRFGGGGGDGQGGETLEELQRKLNQAYSRLRMCESANKMKAAVSQRKLIARLEARKRGLERGLSLRQRQQQAGASVAAAAGAAGDDMVLYYTDLDEMEEMAAAKRRVLGRGRGQWDAGIADEEDQEEDDDLF